MPQGKVALVTGGGRGIGAATALALAQEGFHVAVTARTERELDLVIEQVRASGVDGLSLPADLTQKEQLDHVVEQTERHLGPIDVLVNNAGVGSSADPRPLLEFDDEFWEFSLRLNVTVPYWLIKRTVPGMVQRGWGRVINVASINAKHPSFHGAAYTASKHALAGLTKAAALELGGTGVTVNAVCPGVTRSKMNDLRLQYDAQRLGVPVEQLEREASPLGRRLEPEEVAALIVFLASEQARAINGQLINVCGGKLLAC